MKPKTELKIALIFATLAFVGVAVILSAPYFSGFVNTYKEWKEAGFPNVGELASQFETIVGNGFKLLISLMVFLLLNVFILIKNIKHLE